MGCNFLCSSPTFPIWYGPHFHGAVGRLNKLIDINNARALFFSDSVSILNKFQIMSRWSINYISLTFLQNILTYDLNLETDLKFMCSYL
jgi:hypothetical protein